MNHKNVFFRCERLTSTRSRIGPIRCMAWVVLSLAVSFATGCANMERAGSNFFNQAKMVRGKATAASVTDAAEKQAAIQQAIQPTVTDSPVAAANLTDERLPYDGPYFSQMVEPAPTVGHVVYQQPLNSRIDYATPPAANIGQADMIPQQFPMQQYPPQYLQQIPAQHLQHLQHPPQSQAAYRAGNQNQMRPTESAYYSRNMFGHQPQAGTTINSPAPNPLPQLTTTPEDARLGSVAPSQEQLASYPPLTQGFGHLANGMGITGSQFQQRRRTATEEALELRNRNEALNLQNAALKDEIVSHKETIKALEDKVKQAKALTENSNQQNATLRELVARLRVETQELSEEKASIAQNANKSLREIESTLDSVLMKTISTKRQNSPNN